MQSEISSFPIYQDMCIPATDAVDPGVLHLSIELSVWNIWSESIPCACLLMKSGEAQRLGSMNDLLNQFAMSLINFPVMIGVPDPRVQGW
jgi:hypothetical protein